MKNRLFLYLTLLIALFLRYDLTINTPYFNWDENALLNEIESIGFLEATLNPLNNLNFHQSAPPLFLSVVKLISYARNPMLYEIFTFFISVFILFIFYKILDLKSNKNTSLGILFLFLLSVNPQLLYNTTTIKQYSFDVLGYLLLYKFTHIIYFDEQWKKWYTIFLAIFIFLSNIYLIISLVSITILILVRTNFFVRNRNLIFSFVSAIILFFVYFYNYHEHYGYIEIKNFMYNFWFKEYSLTLNYLFSRIILIFKTLLRMFVLDIYGILPFLILLFALGYQYFNNLKSNLRVSFELAFLALSIILHIVLDLLMIYPFVASRMIIYLYPVVMLICFRLTKQATGSIKVLIILPLVILSVLNIRYIHYREQDYNAIAKYVPINSTLFMTKREKENFDFFWRNISLLNKKNVRLVIVEKFDEAILQNGMFYTGYYGTEVGKVDLSLATFKDIGFNEIKKYNYHHILGTGVLIHSKSKKNL
jgi:hypothetical protein